jgi:hypothetical protein
MAFNLYFHLFFDFTRLPAIAKIDLHSPGEQAGNLKRYVTYLPDRKFSLDILKDYRYRLDSGEF